jgi:hypothetical protein
VGVDCLASGLCGECCVRWLLHLEVSLVSADSVALR